MNHATEQLNNSVIWLTISNTIISPSFCAHFYSTFITLLKKRQLSNLVIYTSIVYQSPFVHVCLITDGFKLFQTNQNAHKNMTWLFFLLILLLFNAS